MEICLMLVEIDKQDIVQEELMTGFANKQPKIVAGSVEILRTALALFGHKVLHGNWWMVVGIVCLLGLISL